MWVSSLTKIPGFQNGQGMPKSKALPRVLSALSPWAYVARVPRGAEGPFSVGTSHAPLGPPASYSALGLCLGF